jgi:peptidylprolyl isomerase
VKKGSEKGNNAMRALAAASAVMALLALFANVAAAADQALTAQDVLAHSTASDWRALDPESTLYMELAGGRVVIELAPAFAPIHVTNVKQLVRQHYFDGLKILRLQDNYVAQWGDPNEDHKRSTGSVAVTAPPEFLRPLRGSAAFRKLQDDDVYAPQVGFIDSWPVARDPAKGQEWLTHCYAMLGVGRDTAPDSGNGSELYVVVGHAPRHLDRNVALMGRVVQGIELLSSLPRGTGALGFYEKADQYVPIRSISVAADLPAEKRTKFEVLRSDTPLFGDYLDTLRSRRGDWFVEPTNRLEICNARVPVRIKP